MLLKFLACFCLFLLQVFGTYASFDVRYSNFDDYINSLDEDQARQMDEEQEGSGTIDEEAMTHFKLPLRTGLTRSKDETCCSIGHLAGDKGYHCIAKFYAARVLLRNQNRAHNRKLGFHGKYGTADYGTKAMRTFEQCVATRGLVFHKCCRHAAQEKRSKPHFDSMQRKRYESKMRKIRMPKRVPLEEVAW